MKFLFLNLLACVVMIILFLIARLLPSNNTNTMKSILFAAFLSVFTLACKKSVDGPVQPPTPSKVTVRFYSTNAVTSTKVITARVNGADCGRVVYSASQPDCTAATYSTVMLAPGNYAVDYIDASNTMASKQVQITVSASNSCSFFNLK